MTDGWRKAGVFAAGLLLGGAVVLGAYLTWVAPTQTVPPPGAAAAHGALQAGTPASAAAAAAPAAAPPAAPSAAEAAAAAACPAEPLLARTDPRDGQFSLQAALSNSCSDAAAFLKVAAEMAADGRPRDAEVAYIVACRVAAQAAGAPSTPVADVKTRLAQHYAALAGQEAGRELRPQLLQRAEALLEESVRTYAAALGQDAAKTRSASQRLAALAQAGQPSETVLPSGEPGLAPPGSATDPATLGAAAASASGDVNPGSDCANARSPSEKLICSDAELAALDQDLDRLRAQARAVTRDPGGFARRQEQAWTRREAQCRDDKACLRNWYAQRKTELFGEF